MNRPSLYKMRNFEIEALINELRAEAGLPARKFGGTSKQSLVLICNMARRGQF